MENIEVPTTRIFIPDMLAGWPWSRQINPHYHAVKEEGDAWIMSFRAFSPKSQDAYNRCDFGLLTCLAYPNATIEHVKAICALMHLFFVFDEHSDMSTPAEIRLQKDAMIDAFRNPHTPRPKGEWIGGEIARQFWELTIPHTTIGWQKRFIQLAGDYFEGVIRESTYKRDHRILNIKSYLDLRRHHTIGMKPMFAMFELGLDFPDEVIAHPTVRDMTLAAIDMIIFTNDIFSYNMEQMSGEDLHNIITCIMNEYHTDVNGAILWVQEYLLRAKEKFRASMKALPQWEEPLNSHVREYFNNMGQLVRGYVDWSFERERYFGGKGPQIKENKWLVLLPKRYKKEIGPLRFDRLKSLL